MTQDSHRSSHADFVGCIFVTSDEDPIIHTGLSSTDAHVRLRLVLVFVDWTDDHVSFAALCAYSLGPSSSQVLRRPGRRWRPQQAPLFTQNMGAPPLRMEQESEDKEMLRSCMSKQVCDNKYPSLSYNQVSDQYIILQIHCLLFHFRNSHCPLEGRLLLCI